MPFSELENFIQKKWFNSLSRCLRKATMKNNFVTKDYLFKHNFHNCPDQTAKKSEAFYDLLFN